MHQTNRYGVGTSGTSAPPSRASRHQPRLALLLLGALLLVSGLGYGAYRWWQASSSRGGSEVSSTGVAVGDLSSAAFEIEKRRDLSRVNSLIRRYNRREAEWLRSEERYLEAIHLYQLAYGQLTISETPGLFAGEVPSHDERVFDDYLESAEAVLDAVESYVRTFQAEEDANYAALQQTRENVWLVVTEAKFPGTGNKMRDAVLAMSHPDYAAVKAATDEQVAAFGAQGVSNVIHSGGGFLKKLFQMIQTKP